MKDIKKVVDSFDGRISAETLAKIRQEMKDDAAEFFEAFNALLGGAKSGFDDYEKAPKVEWVN